MINSDKWFEKIVQMSPTERACYLARMNDFQRVQMSPTERACYLARMNDFQSIHQKMKHAEAKARQKLQRKHDEEVNTLSKYYLYLDDNRRKK